MTKNRKPWDIFVKFTYKKTLILHWINRVESSLKVLGNLPLALLRKRKDFDFLRQILQKKDIKYYWRIPYDLEVLLPKGSIISMIEQAKQLSEEISTGNISEEPQDPKRQKKQF